MMSRKTIFTVALVALVGLAMGVGSAQAATITRVLGDSGWVAQWQEAPDYDFFVELHTIGVGQDSVLFKKVATFGPSRVDQSGVILPIEILFRQTTYSAKELVVVNSEFVTNNTGRDWGGFQFSIVDNTTGTAGQTQFDPARTGEFNTLGGFHIEPFTTGEYGAISTDYQNLLLTGGVVANGETWMPGGGGTLGQLVINAKPTRAGAFRTFVFEEQPIAIPLPAAAWTGLTGLVGLGLFGAAKKVRSLLA